jgi:MFS family permease
MLVGLSLAETISWGVVYYSFSVFIRPIEAETGWSRTQVTGAFSAALLASGLSAVPVGHWLDARGPRGLMTAGAVAGSLLLLALAGVESLPAFYAIWAGLGVVMAMVLYEPAFAVVATWFVRHRDRALTVLTVGGGLASTLVVPAATWLQQRHGWRAAAIGLAVALAVTTVPLHALLLRRDPSAVGQRPDGDPASTEDVAPVAPPRLGPVMAEGRFWGLTAAFTLASVAAVATSVHVIPYLTERHYSPMAAGTVLGLVGFMQLPGRLVFGPLRRALSWPWAAAAVFLLQGAAIAVLALVPGRAGLGAFVCGFGMANGMCTLLRASMVAELYGPGRYGRVGGVLALFGTAGRAAGPVLASLALAAGASYAAAFSALGGLLVAAALLVLLPWRLAPLAAEVAPSAT